MAADVQDIHADVTIIDREDVQRVAGQLVARPIGPGKPGPVAGRGGGGQQRLLHLGRRFQVPFHAGVGHAQGILGPLERKLRLDPGQDDLEIERLRDVIVGPQLQRADDVVALVLGGGHDDR